MYEHVIVPKPQDTAATVLSTAFRSAMAAPNPKEALPALLRVLGEAFGARRVYVHQLMQNGAEFSCTAEWCAPGTEPMSEVAFGLTVDLASRWFGDGNPASLLVVRDPARLQEVSPAYAALFESRDTQCQILGKLLCGNHPLGTFGFDDPDPARVDTLMAVMLPICAFVASTINAESLLGRIRTAGMIDALTGASTRMVFYQYAESLSADVSMGMAYLDVCGLQGVNDTYGHDAGDGLLISIYQTLVTEFGDDRVFRMSGDEFLVVASDMPEVPFRNAMQRIRRLLDELSVYVALGVSWQQHLGTDYDQMLRRTCLNCANDKLEWERRGGVRLQIHHHANGPSVRPTPKVPHTHNNRSHIDFAGCHQSDEFFHRASVWIRHTDAACVCMMAFDINYFKLYNDIFGRDAGDLMLEEYARGLTRHARKHHGVAGYLGGDNFALMVPATPDLTRDDIRTIIEREVEVYDIAEGFAAACGVVVTSDTSVGATVLYDRALGALQTVKGSYTDHVCFYDRDRYAHERDNQMLLMRAQKALRHNEFTFYLQPKVDIESGKIVSAEALVRWFAGEGLIQTSRFVDLMETSGYIFALDRYIWEQVSAWQRSLIDRGIRPVPISVNVSRIDFHFTDIADHFSDLVRRYGLEPRLIGIEITESAYSEEARRINDVLRRLQQAGFTILMDDFGSGYSSLNMLYDVAVDVLKMDKGFIDHIQIENGSDAIISTVIKMAHMLGMPVVSEGVETEEQRDALRAMGCDYIQGYFYYGPMDRQSFERLLEGEEAMEYGHADDVLVHHPTVC